MNEHRDRLSERAKQRKASKALRQLSSKVNRGLDLTDSEQFIVDKILAIEQGEDVSSKAQSEPVDSKPSEDVAAQTQAVLAEEPLFDLEAGYAWMKTLNKDNVLEELKADPNGFSSQQILDYDEEYRNALLKKLETLYQELYAEVVATAKEIDSDNFQNLEDAIDDFLWFNKDFESNQTLKVFESIINKLEQLRNLKLTNDKINELLEKHEGRVDGEFLRAVQEEFGEKLVVYPEEIDYEDRSPEIIIFSKPDHPNYGHHFVSSGCLVNGRIELASKMQNKENEERNKRTYVDKNLKPGMVISTAPLNNNKKNPVDVLSYNPIIKGKFTFEQ